ncbi:hypothetical protein CRUP_019685 [Coryphaenoides rupestris]|nr:hypothetical protein CRUP_019685 [Coryphaenoides rupestris]
MARTLRHISLFIVTLQITSLLLVPVGAAEESPDCREQEYRDASGACKPCKQCDAGQELSKCPRGGGGGGQSSVVVLVVVVVVVVKDIVLPWIEPGG